MPIVDENLNLFFNSKSFVVRYVGGFYRVDRSFSAYIGAFINEFDVNNGQDAILSNTKINSRITYDVVYDWVGGMEGYDTFKTPLQFKIDIECPHEEAISEIIKKAYDFGEKYAEEEYRGDSAEFLRLSGIV